MAGVPKASHRTEGRTSLDATVPRWGEELKWFDSTVKGALRGGVEATSPSVVRPRRDVHD